MRNRILGVSPTRASQLAFLVAALAILVAHVGAQQKTVVRGPPTCSQCQIRLDHSVTLDGNRSSEVGEPLTLARMSDGRLLLNTMAGKPWIAVFDSTGKHIRTIGRRGGGPGEFLTIGRFRVTGKDTLRIFDIGAHRMTVLTSSFALVQTLPVDIMQTGDLEVLADGRIVAAQNISNVTSAGLPLHIIGKDGKSERSFGAENPEYGREDAHLLWRWIAPAGNDRVWAAPVTEYVLELWAFSGQKIRELERNVSWFKPHKQFGFNRDNPNAPPNPGIMDLRMDSTGKLWVIVHVADEKWTSGLGNVRGLYNRQVRGITEANNYWDSIIEVIDPVAGTLVASQRFDQVLRWISESAYASAYRQDATGVPFIDVFRVSLTTNPRR
ncbi:MAG: 6-bladed beta-propeller [Gemmatimonadota bacterium]